MKRIKTILAAMLALVTSAASAAGFQEAAPSANALPEHVAPLVGKHLTMFPANRGCDMTPIFASIPVWAKPTPPKYHADAPTGLTVEAVEAVQPIPNTDTKDFYYRVRLDDGTVGYIRAGYAGVDSSSVSTTVAAPTWFDCYATFTNAEHDTAIAAVAAVAAAEDARLAAVNAQIAKDKAEMQALNDAAEDLAKKPDARIGMTAKQVREATSWGEPGKVNRTMVSGHTHEQWVYDQDHYLYFDNGRLTSIQNSQ